MWVSSVGLVPLVLMCLPGPSQFWPEVGKGCGRACLMQLWVFSAAAPDPPTSPQGTFPFCEECSQWECCSDVIRTGGEGRPVLLTCRGLRRGALKNQVSARAHTHAHTV